MLAVLAAMLYGKEIKIFCSTSVTVRSPIWR